jgi:uncharacterized protein (DUF488 family)
MEIIFTIGHSTRKIEHFIEILKAHDIEVVVDVRHFPRSRHNPQFNKEVLEKELPSNNISYVWLENLGGFRKGGYKKHMQTEDFRNGIESLMEITSNKKVAIMCAELLWFRCHRRYIADFLKRRGLKVFHIFDKNRVEKHKITFRRKVKCE